MTATMKDVPSRYGKEFIIVRAGAAKRSLRSTSPAASPVMGASG